ncbi:MAG TPA: molybdopterin-binding protein [Fimbriimonadaceae bacterium]|jgi:molybdenum cofactor synthesis domain-containing protein
MRITIGVLAVSGNLDPSESEEIVTNAAIRALSHVGYERVVTKTTPDEPQKQKQELIDLCKTCDIVFTAGGTGFDERDVTPEITAEIVDRRADSLAELIRMNLHKRSETSHLNRGIAGIRGQTIVINLPSTAETVKEAIEAVGLLIRPMMSSLRGSKVVQDVE